MLVTFYQSHGITSQKNMNLPTTTLNVLEGESSLAAPR
jgi:hypothetical protein